MADKKDDSKEEKKKSSLSIELIIIIALVLILLLGGGGMAAYFLLKDDSAGSGPAAEQTVDKKSKLKKPAIYYQIKPTFMVKLTEQRNNIKRTRYLQVDVAIMARDQVVIDAVEQHKPLIMNDLFTMFSNTDYQTMLTVKGKRDMQRKALKIVNTILKREERFTGAKAILFTNFVVQ